jgi:hypothetical protein
LKTRRKVQDAEGHQHDAEGLFTGSGSGGKPPKVGETTTTYEIARQSKVRRLYQAAKLAVETVVVEGAKLFSGHAADVLLVADDFSKLSAAKHADPIAAATGISANDLVFVASHVLSRVFRKVGLMKAAPDYNAMAAALLKIVGKCWAALGVKDLPLPDRGEVAKMLRKRIEG